MTQRCGQAQSFRLCLDIADSVRSGPAVPRTAVSQLRWASAGLPPDLPRPLEVGRAGAVRGRAGPPGVEADKGDGGGVVFQAGYGQAKVAGAADAGDVGGLGGGALDAAAGVVALLPGRGGLLGARRVQSSSPIWLVRILCSETRAAAESILFPHLACVPVERAWRARRCAARPAPRARQQETAQARQRLSAACYWPMTASTAVQFAGQADPVHDDARELLHAIPANTEPARPMRRSGETITELCESAVATAEQARRASWTLAPNAAWSTSTPRAAVVRTCRPLAFTLGRSSSTKAYASASPMMRS